MREQDQVGEDAVPAREGPGDLVAGGLSAMFGVVVLLYIRGFPELPDGQPGPALFPGIIAGLFVVFGATLVVRCSARRRSAVPGPHPVGEATPPASRTAVVDALAVLGSVVVYLLVVDTLGFVLTMGPLLLLLMWRLGASVRLAVAGAVGTTLLLLLLFQRLLLVPLPAGLLG